MLLAYQQAPAQIYTCTAEDGTRVFSDKRCGPDAKVVKGVTTRKKSNAAATSRTAPVKVRSPAELEQLLERCNDGDEAACMTWSKGGGPEQLRAMERQQETSCAGGSLTACEQRYCRDGATDECRKRVMSLATLSGETWYLRYQQKLTADAPATYSVRCLREGSREIRDVTISCAPTAGPNRCQVGQAQQGFPRLDAAAASYCSVQQ
ncbi:MAG TPA: DUF4124 domain-containing protein [Povalibacter sp.]|nr:DUF4124 domain-containing protein [Povalibacter sp.]